MSHLNEMVAQKKLMHPIDYYLYTKMNSDVYRILKILKWSE